MTRQNVQERCRRICAGYSENSVCCFADNGGLLGFIDTSQGQNGTRGIAFSNDRVLMNFDGEPIEILYKKIKSVQIISSFEDFFADELSVIYSDKEIRISDFSLDKSELKRLLDAFCGAGTEEKAVVVPQKGDVLPKNAAAPQNGGILPRNVGDPVREPVIPARHGSAPMPERQPNAAQPVSEQVSAKTVTSSEQIHVNNDRSAEQHRAEIRNDHENEVPSVFQRRDDFVDIIFEDRAPVITETVLPHSSGMRTTVIERQTPPAFNDGAVVQAQERYPRNDDDDETAERIRIQNMSPEETLSFLAQSFNEINSPEPARRPEPSRRDNTPLFRSPEVNSNDNTPLFRQSEIVRRESGTLVQPQQTQTQHQPQPQVRMDTPTQAQPRANIDHSAHKEEPVQLTVEPIWGDIYIKASRNLRELCESGRLSMKQIETELDNKLLDSARAFAEITADESKVPKVLIPKITELKAAAKNFDTYFQSGEDIAVRAMFFMLYQMLSYADRIVETPETKERLNDFFRRFGPAGITLSMLDMRV